MNDEPRDKREMASSGGEMIVYQSEDGRIKLDLRLERETLWVTQSDMARLFQCSPDNIALHIKNIYDEGELDPGATAEDFSVVRQEGRRQVRRTMTCYNLDLDFAELQALQRKAMTMREWVGKLDDFLRLSGRDILTHAGTISHEAALQKAHDEYEQFRRKQLAEPTEVEMHFIAAEQELKQIESATKRIRRKSASSAVNKNGDA